jgi:hypothetical protein
VSKVAKYGLLVVLAILTLLLLYLGFGWRQSVIVESPLLPVAFEHIDHNQQPCAECHHNYIDDSGGGVCYTCHKLTPELAPEMESMFHDFCRGCHVQKRAHGEDSGPLRQCSLCHD